MPSPLRSVAACLGLATLLACGAAPDVADVLSVPLASQEQAVCACPIPLKDGEAPAASAVPPCPVSQCVPLCGNGICEAGEDQWSCSSDCGPAIWCGDQICNGGETEATCPYDCYCGDGVCRGETVSTCPRDCGCPSVCGDGACSSGESTVTCPGDCGTSCGDGACNGSESWSSCLADCGWCGDGYCVYPETRSNCPDDCNTSSCNTAVRICPME